MKIKHCIVALMSLMMMNISCSEPISNTPPTPEKPEQKPEEDLSKDTSGPYKIGDFYKLGDIAGVVFNVNPEGLHGLIISLEEGATQWSTRFVVVGTENVTTGAENIDIIKLIPGWEVLLPAYKWCNDRNKDGVEGWYLPGLFELKAIYSCYTGSMSGSLSYEYRNKFNRALIKYGGTALSEAEHWSSSECSINSASVLNFTDQSTFCGIKTNEVKVRAVRAF